MDQTNYARIKSRADSNAHLTPNLGTQLLVLTVLEPRIARLSQTTRLLPTEMLQWDTTVFRSQLSLLESAQEAHS